MILPSKRTNEKKIVQVPSQVNKYIFPKIMVRVEIKNEVAGYVTRDERLTAMKLPNFWKNSLWKGKWVREEAIKDTPPGIKYEKLFRDNHHDLRFIIKRL